MQINVVMIVLKNLKSSTALAWLQPWLGRLTYVNIYLEVKVMVQVYHGCGYVYSIQYHIV